ncbi:MAG: ABC transporter ATP-binding protein [Stellaceae bacterium]
MVEIALETRDLRKNFGGLAVLEGIDFALGRGERHAIIGPNGSGKSTFVNVVTGLLPPSSGTILMFDRDITAATPQQRTHAGLARSFQINTLFPALNPLQSTVAAMCQRDGIRGLSLKPLMRHRPQIEEAAALLERYGLGDDALVTTRLLPYGKQRLLEIALGVALRPRVLVLDEPAAGLSTGQGHDLFARLAELPPETAIIFVEHDMGLVFSHADRISVFAGGRMLAQGRPDEVRANDAVRAAYLGT